MVFRTLRFLVGLSLVVGGVTLAAPFVLKVVDVRDRPVEGERAYPTAAMGEGMAPVHPPLYAPHTIPDSMAQGSTAAVPPAPPVAESMPLEPSTASLDETGSLDAAALSAEPYVPPAPPPPIPRTASDWSLAAPPLDAAYRSTLDVPPPPLLDAATPPAVMVGWTPREPAQPASWAGVSSAQGGQVVGGSANAVGAPATLPASHVVRDGDDLTGIASRLYGHPGAAEAIWSANRDRLTDPNLLPIGLELRLPSSWTPPATRAGQPEAAAVIEPARRPAKVRVAPGESLETLAVRYYGNRAVAGRLWEANRDQLRNPALIVPGMELRLP
jgi:nucleoid-associated protein YgaU